jgi:hypothetical protein
MKATIVAAYSTSRAPFRPGVGIIAEIVRGIFVDVLGRQIKRPQIGVVHTLGASADCIIFVVGILGVNVSGAARRRALAIGLTRQPVGNDGRNRVASPQAVGRLHVSIESIH